MQKKHLIPILLLSYAILHTPYSILAASPSPSHSIEPASINEVTDNLKKRLQESLSTKDSTGPTARGYIGVVKDIIKDTIILEDKDGKKDVKLTPDTVILRSPGNSVIKADNIRLGDYIIAIGYQDSDNSLTGRRLIVSIDPIKVPDKTSGIGTISKIGPTTKTGKTTLTLKLADKDQVIGISTKTIIKSPVGTIELADLNIGDTIIYTAIPDDGDSLSATILMRIQTDSITE